MMLLLWFIGIASLVAGLPEHSTEVRISSWETSVSTNFTGPPIRVGTALTLDCCSRHQSLGQALRRAYELFFENLNRVRGGVLVGGQRRPVELVLIGDYSDKQRVREVTEHIVNDLGIKLLLGPYSSTLTEPAASVAAATGAVLVAPGASSPSVFRDRPTVFGMLLPATKFLESSFDLVAARGGIQTVAYIQETASFPRGVCSSVPILAARHGFTVVANFTVTDSSSLNETVSELQRIKPDFVVNCVYNDVCRAVLKASQAINYVPPASVFTICVTSPGFLTELGVAGRFVMGVTAWMPSMPLFSTIADDWSAQVFAEKYKSRFGLASVGDVPYQAAAAWAAGAVLVAGIEAADSLDPLAVSTAIQSINLDTLFGPVRFDAKGQSASFASAVQFQAWGDVPILVAPPSVAKPGAFFFPIPEWTKQRCFAEVEGNLYGFLEDGETCDVCPDNQVSEVNLSTFSWHCVPCPPGKVAYLMKGLAVRMCKPECSAGSIPDGEGGCRQCLRGMQPVGLECVPCSAGTFASEIGQPSCVACAPGTFANSSKQSGCMPCEPGSASNNAGASSCRFCPRGTFAEESGSQDCSPCEPGSAVGAEGALTCDTCPPGQYSGCGAHVCEHCPVGKFQDQAHQSLCRDCFQGGTCPRPGLVYSENQPGYWVWRRDHHENSSVEVSMVQCMTPQECLTEERCLDGQTGVLCRVCLPGYARTLFSGVCFQCPSYAWNTFVSIIFTAIAMVGVYVMIALNIQSAYQVKAVSSTILKLLLNYGTTMMVVSHVAGRVIIEKKLASQYIERFVKALLALLDSDPIEKQSTFWSPDCLFQPALDAISNTAAAQLAAANHSEGFADPALDNARAQLREFHWEAQMGRTVFWIIAPGLFVLLLLVIGGCFLYAHVYRKRHFYENALNFYCEIRELGFSPAMKELKPEDWVDFIDAYEYRFIGVWRSVEYVRKTLPEFTVHFLKESQAVVVISWFVIYPGLVRAILHSLQCTRPLPGLRSPRLETSLDVECYDTSDVLLWVSIGGIFLFGIGFPALCYYTLKKLKRKLFQPRTLRCWGFLYNGYELDHYAWELVVLCRKFAGFILVVLHMEEEVRLLCLLVTACFFSAMHLWYTPFDNRFNELLDKLESRHLLLWVVSCILIQGMTFVHEAKGILVLGIVLLVINALYVYTTLRYFVRHLINDYAGSVITRTKRANDVHALHGLVSWTGQGVETYDSGTNITRHSPLWHSLAVPQLGHCLELCEMNLHDVFDRLTTRFERVQLDKHIKYLHRKPYVCMNHSMSWVSIFGSHSDHCKLPSITDNGSLNDVEPPPKVKRAKHYDREYLLTIIVECLKHVIVTQRITTFSTTLLEFIVRVGFTSIQNLSRSHTQSSRQATMLEKASVAKKVHMEAKALGDPLADDDPECDSPESPESKLADAEERGRAIERDVTSAAILSRSGRQIRDGVHQEVSPHVISMDEQTVVHLVEKMFNPDLFHRGLPLSSFQQNLSRLLRTPEPELRMWLAHFETQWKRRNERAVEDVAVQTEPFAEIHDVLLEARLDKLDAFVGCAFVKDGRKEGSKNSTQGNGHEGSCNSTPGNGHEGSCNSTPGNGHDRHDIVDIAAIQVGPCATRQSSTSTLPSGESPMGEEVWTV